MTQMRDVASLRFSEPVPNVQRRHFYGRTPAPKTIRDEQVDPLVMATARARLRVGERIVIVDTRTVRLVPR